MPTTGSEQILSYVPDEGRKQILELFKRAGPGMEFEFIFFSKKAHQMNKEKYVLLLKYMRSMAKAKKIQVTQPERTLDFGYTASSASAGEGADSQGSSDGLVYRVSCAGSENINRVLNRLSDIQNKNYLIYKFLLYTLRKNNTKDYLTFMAKSRGAKDTIDIDDLNMRARLSKEEDLTEKIKTMKTIEENLDKLIAGKTVDLETRKLLEKRIFFRLKERTSLLIEDEDNHFIRIDLTDTKTTKDLRKISDVSSNYELEIEYGTTSDKAVKKEHLDKMYVISEGLLKFIQQSPFIIGNSMSDKVVQYYKELSNIDANTQYLVGRQPVSLEIQHVTEILPNRYAVSDKADGDRCFLIIYQNGVYLINTNLIVKDTGIVLDKKLEKYNGTILDGEYIYIPKERRHVFMTFDCLRNGSTDVKSVISFMQRLENADKIIEDCFIFKGQTGFKYKPAPQQESFNVNEVSQFYGKELERFYSVLNKDMQLVKEYPLIRRKYFMPVFGALRWEIFKYSVEFWSKYTEDANVKFPYLLDGLMYHPLEQAYVTNVNESKYQEYKWKPPVKNSIDFYIEFKKDPQNGKILDVYDNSLVSDKIDGTGDTGTVRNKTYRICTLYVGKTVEGREIPVPFEQNYGVPDAYIYQRDGEIRDLSGDILTDKTVVEFYYQNDPTIIPQQRWVPIKTRYDKTESVEKYGRRYGNYSGTADRIWRSIINPVLMDDFIELAKGNTDKRNFYDIKIKEMNSKISHQLIVAVNKENKYYQKVTKIASTMRQYHNYIKSNLIYTYCNKMYQSNNQLSVLDIGFGRGGDIGKYYYTEVAYLVGIDIDAEGFKSPVDGAISRYNAFRKKKPNFPKMYFIQADARALLDYDSQVKSLSGMDDINKKMLQKFFPNVDDGQKSSMFDRINCQFAMHYFLKDELSWSNFKQNLKNHLRSGGYFVATTFDAREVIKTLGTRDTYTVYYDDSDGNKKKFFEIIKRYDLTDASDTTKLIGPGSGIDVYMSWAFDEGNYQTEYLVDFEFIKADLEKDADLELVDSDLFSNQLVVHRKFLQDATLFESSNETKEYMANVAQYYDNDEMNRKCMEYTNLHRYFVFRKRSTTDVGQSDKNKKKQKGGKAVKEDSNKEKITLQEKYNFSDVKQFKIPDMANYDDKYSFINSVHKVLVSHSILPKSVSVEEFVQDLGLELVKDLDVTEDYIQEFSKKVVINHEIVEGGKSKIENLLNGLNLFFVERDCNNFYDITFATTKKPKDSDRAVVLMKEGGLYKPLMRKEPKGIRGVLRMKDEMIKELMDNGEKL
ncbi:mRNA capping enzyme [Yasminevirus sp. GU-2018]|uniref:mRNA capping enzyme n=1 Tax=Yasminevirus sp. GU-2018 TaxID=2420051 RepID=A0A5K0U9Z0_9VIRU|nr:mRNA capping enzyme [Yasminevirus sp. GU-2018]